MEKDNQKQPPAVAEIIDEGPLKISGNIHLKDLKRNINLAATEVLICRCGRSGNKPFCDGTHCK